MVVLQNTYNGNVRKRVKLTIEGDYVKFNFYISYMYHFYYGFKAYLIPNYG